MGLVQGLILGRVHLIFNIKFKSLVFSYNNFRDKLTNSLDTFHSDQMLFLSIH